MRNAVHAEADPRSIHYLLWMCFLLVWTSEIRHSKLTVFPEVQTSSSFDSIYPSHSPSIHVGRKSVSSIILAAR